ncbi:MAG: 2,5-diketo-D-gluconate reductase A [Promethearchaeota archaeon]|nr:MAG: 2,5-diketo-D-gluconate reductase A [Candidatus Lokiarchaeota archaeon]
MNFTIKSSIKLNNDLEIPMFGFGTWDLRRETAYYAVQWAIEEGYRLIDTASMYGNESRVGKAIKNSDVDREEIFLTTKIWPSEMGYESTFKALEKSLKNLKTEYLDLYLIHWPKGKWRETWKAMEELYKEGKVKSIGVSNFTIDLLEEHLNKFDLKPVVNQVEFHPFLYQRQLLEYCRSKNIRLEAYAPLTRTEKFGHPILKNIAEKYGKSVPQILLRWGLQHSIIEIPRSSSKTHIKENANVFDFEIKREDMGKLDSLNQDYRLVEDSVFN